MSHYDAIIIGGGLAGSLVAIELAKSGRQTLLLEKESEAHHKVCGEFISYEAQAHLARLGIDLQALGAVPIDSLRLIRGRRTVTARLPFRAMSLSRYVLDEALLEIAVSHGVEVRRSSTACGLLKTGVGWQVDVTTGGGEHLSYAADTIFLATGKHDLRGYKRPPGMQNNLIGLKMHFLVESNSRDDTIDVIFFQGGYAGLERIEGGKVNLCLVIDKETFAGFDKSWDRLISTLKKEVPELSRRLRGAEPCWPKPLAVFGIPYGLVNDENHEKGLYRIGDQFAVIPSFSGNGMSIALETATAAVHHYLHEKPGYERQVARKLKFKIKATTLLSRLVVHPFSNPLLFSLCQVMPQFIYLIAMRTRIAPKPRRLA